MLLIFGSRVTELPQLAKISKGWRGPEYMDVSGVDPTDTRAGGASNGVPMLEVAAMGKHRGRMNGTR